MNKKLSSTILIVMLALAGYLVVRGMQADKSDNTPSGVYKAASSDPVSPSESPISETPAVTVSVNAGTTTINRTDDGFSPSQISIKKGDTVTFVNQSTDPMWPASNPHPAHTGYPEGGGCRASSFDACKGIPPGASWSYTFNDVGTWGFHDHLSPQFTGTITVK